MPYTNNHTGYRNTDTSAQAAIQVEPKGAALRDAVLAAMRAVDRPLAADEVAALLNINILSIRPRMTELQGKEKIRDSGKRGKTAMGKSCILWEVA